MIKKLGLKFRNIFLIFYFKIKSNKYKTELNKCKVTLDYIWTSKINRTKIIQQIINDKNFKSYLEIGCDQNQNFSKIKINKKTGIDPKKGGTFRGTSDDFFKQNSEKFDIIFIDGLHVSHQVDKDIKNSLNVLNENGVILLHDCIPKSIKECFIPRIQLSWTGDVWKSIVKIRSKNEVDCTTILEDHGISIILKRPNSLHIPFSTRNSQAL